jgi:REP element-mobilizing transposase RayT
MMGKTMTLFKNQYRIETARLRGYDYSSSGLYFVTICSKNRVCYFGDVVNGKMELSPIGDIVADEWQKTPNIRANVQLDEWIVMPNHLHGIIWITHTVETFRRNVSTELPRRNVSTELPRRDVSTELSPRDVSTKAATQSRLQPNSLGSIIGQIKSICTKRVRAAGFGDFDWQERFHDQIIRNERALDAVRAYIANNPANWDKDKDNPVGLRM